MLPLTKLGQGRPGQTKIWGEVKWASNPCVRVKDKAVCLSDTECSYLPRGTYPIVEEWHCTLGRTKPDMTLGTQGCASLKEGDEPCDP